MSNRNRPRSRRADTSREAPFQEEALRDDTFQDPSPYEVGETTLDLDDISEDVLASLYFSDDEEESSSFFNVPSIAGLSLILLGIAYLLTSLGVWTGPDLGVLIEMLPIVGGVMIILLGFGLLSWRSKDKKKVSLAELSSKREPEVSEKSAASKEEESESSGLFSSVSNPLSSKKRLRRSRTDKKVLGVCGGLADYLNLDSTLVRIAFVIGVIASGGPFVLAYLGLAFAMPKEDKLTPKDRIRIIRDS
mgnify:CR=1 FL=1